METHRQRHTGTFQPLHPRTPPVPLSQPCLVQGQRKGQRAPSPPFPHPPPCLGGKGGREGGSWLVFLGVRSLQHICLHSNAHPHIATGWRTRPSSKGALTHQCTFNCAHMPWHNMHILDILSLAHTELHTQGYTPMEAFSQRSPTHHCLCSWDGERAPPRMPHPGHTGLWRESRCKAMPSWCPWHSWCGV